MAKIHIQGNGYKSGDEKSLRSTMESLVGEESDSLGSDLELNGVADKYGFIGGSQQGTVDTAENIPPEVLRQREVKWLEMLNSWDKWMSKKHKKVKLRCQKGIPPSLRGRAWLYLSGGKVKREQNQGKFQEAIQLDGEILFSLLKRVSPVAHRHLKKHKIDPVLYMTEWFMCAFSRTLPWASVLRVWDIFFCEGVKVIFRVGLVLLKCMLGSQEKLKACPGQYETMERLRAIESCYMQEGFLIKEILELQLSERDVEKEHLAQLQSWKESHGELHCKSPPRMHGARAIMAAEPPSRQDLQQKPTIVIDPAQINNSEKKEKDKSKAEKKRNKKDSTLDTPEDQPVPDQSQPMHRETFTLQASNQSLSSTEQDTYL
ncbi:TBC1 domain family member 10A [Bagarius yarrelli]|uniref:TBC1 domain family member 10A n=1 Tax=Bagarius yarrelli TaxID=175774 RepID=A0A556U2Q2_BAGYA|nr:TBC1 domain family member 10A [Bagarius yarrelli]